MSESSGEPSGQIAIEPVLHRDESVRSELRSRPTFQVITPDCLDMVEPHEALREQRDLALREIEEVRILVSSDASAHLNRELVAAVDEEATFFGKLVTQKWDRSAERTIVPAWVPTGA